MKCQPEGTQTSCYLFFYKTMEALIQPYISASNMTKRHTTSAHDDFEFKRITQHRKDMIFRQISSTYVSELSYLAARKIVLDIGLTEKTKSRSLSIKYLVNKNTSIQRKCTEPFGSRFEHRISVQFWDSPPESCSNFAGLKKYFKIAIDSSMHQLCYQPIRTTLTFSNAKFFQHLYICLQSAQTRTISKKC